jgi:hypothetical protein
MYNKPDRFINPLIGLLINNLQERLGVKVKAEPTIPNAWFTFF